MKNRCVIFDLDETLVKSSKNLANSINFTRQKIGLESLEENLLDNYINELHDDLPLKLYDKKEFSPEVREIFYKHYIDTCIDDLKLYDGMAEILKNLKNDGIKLAIATNSYEIFVKKMLKYLDIEKYFNVIICADKVRYPKPSGYMLGYIMTILDVRAKDCILVGDSIKDYLSAKDEKTHFIKASWGVKRDFKCKYECKDLNTLINTINQIF